MNKERRRSINNIKANIARLKKEKTDETSELSIVLDQEKDAFENMPEALQSSMRGMDSEDAIDLMEEAIDSLDDAIKSLGDIL